MGYFGWPTILIRPFSVSGHVAKFSRPTRENQAWACGEILPADPGEPSVGLIVLNVCWVDEGNQDVDVQ